MPDTYPNVAPLASVQPHRLRAIDIYTALGYIPASSADVTGNRDVANVLSAGAKGDGSDDLAAIQNLLTASAGKIPVVIPLGVTCSISNTLFVPANSHFRIEGTLRLLPMGAGPLRSVIEINGSNVLIDGGRTGVVDGNRAGYTGDQYGTGFSAAGIATYAPGLTNIHITDLEIKNAVNWPINITESVSNVLVDNCHLHDSGNSVEFNKADNCHFRGNTVHHITDAALVLYAGDSNCSITNNVVHSSWNGVHIYSDTDQILANTRCVVSDNIVYGIRDYGIAVLGVIGGQTAIWCMVHNNQCFGNGTGGTAGTGSFKFEGVDGLSVVGNMAYGDLGTNPYAFWLRGPLNNVLMMDNQVMNCGVPGGTGSFGIVVTGSTTPCTGTVIKNNTVTDSRGGGAASAYAIYTGGLDLGLGCVVADNHAIGTFSQSNPIFINPLAAGVVVEGYMTANNSANRKVFKNIGADLISGDVISANALKIGSSTTAGSSVMDFYTTAQSGVNDGRILFTPGVSGLGDYTSACYLYANIVVLPGMHVKPSYANDAAAAAAGVPVDGIYRNGNALQVRLS